MQPVAETSRHESHFQRTGSSLALISMSQNLKLDKKAEGRTGLCVLELGARSS